MTIWIKADLWNTVVIMWWSAVQGLPDGSSYDNYRAQINRMRWGKHQDLRNKHMVQPYSDNGFFECDRTDDAHRTHQCVCGDLI